MTAWRRIAVLALALALLAPVIPAAAQGDPEWRVDGFKALPFEPVALRDVYPAPDGWHYLYMDGRALCVAEADDEQRQCIAVPDDFPAFLGTGNPVLRALAWSPDSTRIAIVGPVGMLDGDLWVWDLVGGTLTNLSDDGFAGLLSDAPPESVRLAQPAWSPDGTRIAVARSGAEVSAFERLAVLDAASGATVYATASPVDFVIGPDDLTFTPDGRALVISQGFGRGEPDNGLWRIELETGERRLLTSGGTFNDWLNQISLNDYSTQIGPLVWSPDGSRLVAWAGSGAFDEAPGAGFLIDAETGEVGHLPLPFEYLILSSLVTFDPFQVAWSPDGSALLIAADGALPSYDGLKLEPEADGGRVTIYVADVEEWVGRVVAEVPARNAGNGPLEDYTRHAQAVWGPDGYTIIAGYALHLAHND